MSRVKTLLVAIILVVGILFPTTTLASPGATVSITDATLPTGASGSVALTISGISADRPVSCITVDVNYEPSVVEVLSVSGSDFSSLVDNIQNPDGYTRLVAYVTSETGLTGTIKVADIALTMLGGESSLTLDVETLKDDDGQPILFTVDNGLVTSGGAPPVDDIPPTVTAASPASGATGVAITATVRATFGEVIDSGTLAFSVGGVGGTTTYTGTTATFTPGANLAYSRTYTASVSASDLAGNPMAVAYSWSFTTAAAPPAGGGGGGGGGGGPAPPPPGTTDIRGMLSTSGRFWYKVTAISEDELCRLSIPRGTVGLTEELEPLTEITMLIMDEPPAPPEDAHVIGLGYDFEPSGATFDPAITLTFSYDPADIPEGVAEEDLVIAYYVAGEWVELEGCVVDTENNTITASVSHFTTFAIVGTVPPPPPAPAPAALSVSNLSIKPAEVQPKETVTIAVSVANTGEVEGSYSVVLEINGVKEAEKSVTVAAGSSEDVGFTVTREEAASYDVVVDGLSGSFTVKALPAPVPAPPPAPPAKPINWTVIGGIIAGVVIVISLVVFLVRRRRAY